MSSDRSQGTVIYKCAFGHGVNGRVYFGRGAFGINLIWEVRRPLIEQEDLKFGTTIDTEAVC